MRKILSLILVASLIIGLGLPSFANNYDFVIDASLIKETYIDDEIVEGFGVVKKNNNSYSNANIIIQAYKIGDDIACYATEVKTNNTGEFDFQIEGLEVGQYKLSLILDGSEPIIIKNLYFNIIQTSSTLNVNKLSFNNLSDKEVKISGVVYSGELPLSNRDVVIKIYYENNDDSIYVDQLLTDTEGKFSTVWMINNQTKAGKYKVKADINEGNLTLIKEFSIINGWSQPITPPPPIIVIPPPIEEDGSEENEEDDVIISENEDGSIVVDIQVDESTLEDELNSSDEIVTIDANIEENASEINVSLSSDIIESVSDKNKKIEIKTNDSIIQIDPESLEIDKGEEVKLSVTKLAEKEVSILESKKKSDNYNLVANIYDFNLSKIANDIESKLTFKKPLTITLNYNKDSVIDFNKLGVYYFNEEKQKWEYVGGKPSSDGTITFKAKHFSKYSVMEYNKTFLDAKNHWATKYIELVASKHIINGMNENEFKPDDNVTRAQFATMLVLALNLEKGNIEVNFKDVEDGKWYTDFIETVASLGIVKGYEDNTFKSNREITRQEMATMLVTAIKYVNPNLESKKESNFTDNDKIASWSKGNVNFAYSNGLISGFPSDNTFRPENKATRAQAAVVIYNLLKLLNKI